MKANISIKTMSLLAVLAVSSAVSAASHAAADARTVNSFNEGSEPNFLRAATAPALVKSEDKVRVVGAARTKSSGFFAKFDEEVLYRKAGDADTNAINAVNEGQVNLPYGQ